MVAKSAVFLSVKAKSAVFLSVRAKSSVFPSLRAKSTLFLVLLPIPTASPAVLLPLARLDWTSDVSVSWKILEDVFWCSDASATRAHAGGCMTDSTGCRGVTGIGSGPFQPNL